MADTSFHVVVDVGDDGGSGAASSTYMSALIVKFQKHRLCIKLGMDYGWLSLKAESGLSKRKSGFLANSPFFKAHCYRWVAYNGREPFCNFCHQR